MKKQSLTKIDPEIQRMADTLREFKAQNGFCTREDLLAARFTPDFINQYNEIATGIANEDEANSHNKRVYYAVKEDEAVS